MLLGKSALAMSITEENVSAERAVFAYIDARTIPCLFMLTSLASNQNGLKVNARPQAVLRWALPNLATGHSEKRASTSLTPSAVRKSRA